MKPQMRIGIGYDIHPLKIGGVLRLGGVAIDADRGYAAGKDHDVLLHSLIDALAGALCLGDVSDFLTDSVSPERVDADPMKSLAASIEAAGYRVASIDCNIVSGVVILRPYVTEIGEAVATRLGIERQRVSIKGRSNGGFREEGEGLAISSHSAVCVEAVPRSHRWWPVGRSRQQSRS